MRVLLQSAFAAVFLDEIFYHFMGLVVAELLRRGFHEVGGGAEQGAFEAVVQTQFAAADSVDDYAGRVGRVPDFEFEFQVEGHTAKGFAFHADVAPLPVFQPWDVIAGAHVDIFFTQVVVELRGDGSGFANFLRFEAGAFQHVVKVCVAAKVELVGAQEFHAAFAEEVG